MNRFLSSFLNVFISFHNPISKRNFGFSEAVNFQVNIFNSVKEFIYARVTKDCSFYAVDLALSFCWTWLFKMKMFICELITSKKGYFLFMLVLENWLIHCKKFFVTFPKFTDCKKNLFQKLFFESQKMYRFLNFKKDAFWNRGQHGRGYIILS